MDEQSQPQSQAGVAELLERGLAEAKSLARLELALAKDEALTELRALHTSYVAFVTCATFVSVAIAALVASLVVATTYAIGLVVGTVAIVAAVAFGHAGYKRLPANPMKRTRRRLVHDARDIQEKLA